MRNVLFIFCSLFLLVDGVNSEVAFPAHKLRCVGTFSYGTEYYVNYVYHGDVVFRVLYNYKPAVDAYIKYAIDIGGNIIIRNPEIVAFKTQQEIRQQISVRPSEGSVVLEPKQVELEIMSSGCFGRKSYFLSLADGDQSFQVSKRVYRAISAARATSFSKGKKLRLDLAKLLEGRAEFVSVVFSNENNKRHCFSCENEPNILLEPCNHICLCGDCAESIVGCPLCEKNVESKRKVYY